MRSIAIYGFDPHTRDFIHESEADEVWTLNNAYDKGVPLDRVTRWYELHSHDRIFNSSQSAPYVEWLKQEHPFDIYMQRRYNRIPRSKVYPLNEIAHYIDGNRRYFTNSIAYMIAHAIYEGVDRIEVYGIDMAKGTEYAYQKGCTEYMAAHAIARGIEFYVPPDCALLNAPLYSYETNVNDITEDELRRHLSQYSGDDLLSLGAKEALESVLQTLIIDGRATRQSMEIMQAQYQNSFNTAISAANYCSGMVQVYMEYQNRNKADENARKVAQHRDSVELYDGAIQATQKTIDHMDNLPVDFQLKSTTRKDE